MSYIVITEDLKTVLHNIWTRPIFGIDGGYDPTLGSKVHTDYMRERSSGYAHYLLGAIPLFLSTVFNFYTNGTDYIDNRYFDSMYKISPGLAKKLAQWCDELGVDPFTISNINGKFSINGIDIQVDNHKDSTPNRHKPKAHRGFFQKGTFTTCTAYKKIQSQEKGKYYIVYFTFDGDSIQDAKVLFLKDGMNPNRIDSFGVRTIRKFKSVKSEEYKK